MNRFLSQSHHPETEKKWKSKTTFCKDVNETFNTLSLSGVMFLGFKVVGDIGVHSCSTKHFVVYFSCHY